MTKVSRIKKRKRQEAYRKTDAFAKTLRTCRNCGEKGPHFVPPGFGGPGFYSCLKPGQTQDEKDQEIKRAYEGYRQEYNPND